MKFEKHKIGVDMSKDKWYDVSRNPIR